MAFAEGLFGMGGRKMEGKSLGFIGAGRIARILLGGLKRAGKLPSKIIVSDANEDVLQKLKKDFLEIDAFQTGITGPQVRTWSLLLFTRQLWAASSLRFDPI
jgi:hypothetical protein